MTTGEELRRKIEALRQETPAFPEEPDDEERVMELLQRRAVDSLYKVYLRRLFGRR